MCCRLPAAIFSSFPPPSFHLSIFCLGQPTTLLLPQVLPFSGSCPLDLSLLLPHPAPPLLPATTTPKSRCNAGPCFATAYGRSRLRSWCWTQLYSQTCLESWSSLTSRSPQVLNASSLCRKFVFGHTDQKCTHNMHMAGFVSAALRLVACVGSVWGRWCALVACLQALGRRAVCTDASRLQQRLGQRSLAACCLFLTAHTIRLTSCQFAPLCRRVCYLQGLDDAAQALDSSLPGRQLRRGAPHAARALVAHACVCLIVCECLPRTRKWLSRVFAAAQRAGPGRLDPLSARP